METDVQEIRYAAASGGVAPLTWSQEDMLRVMRALPGRHVHFNMTFSIVLPAGTRTGRVVDVLRAATENHEALRTTVTDAATDHPTQHVHGRGRLVLRLHAYEACDDTVVREVSRLSRRTPVGFPGEETFRPDLILVDGQPHTLVLTFNHLTLDGFSVPVLNEDLLRRLSGSSGLPPAQSPRERAEFEQGPGGTAQSARSLRTLERNLASAPATPLRPVAGGGDPAPFWWGRMRSPSLAAVLPALAERYAVPTSAVLIGIVGSLLAPGAGAFAVSLVVANRFLPGLRASLGCYFQPVPLTVGVDNADFAETARKTAAAVTRAAMNGQFAPSSLSGLLDQIETETGRVLRPMPVFNVQEFAAAPGALSPEAARDLVAHSSYESTGLTGMEDDGLYLNATTREGTLELVLRTRTDRMPAAAGEQLLRSVEDSALALYERRAPSPAAAVPPASGRAPFVNMPGIPFCSCDTHAVDNAAVEEMAP
ncbi:condensation domain-containing protein [Streptomyces sp. NPDC033538]|uniref:condensation domain-containing protein n=1 Tax=Streptomyces sp. NPDC033538 TaxID=3155367 RepID=UPI0033D4DC31